MCIYQSAGYIVWQVMAKQVFKFGISWLSLCTTVCAFLHAHMYLVLCVWQFMDFSLRHMYTNLGIYCTVYVVITMYLVHRAPVIAMNTAAYQSYFKTQLW